MILLTPALLGLLSLGGILIAFYVWRARHQRHAAPTTLLWQEALTELQQRPAWRPPWRHLLLLLQLAALLLLTLSLAQPAAPSATPQHLVLVMDAAVQMGATDVIDNGNGARDNTTGTRKVARFAAASTAARTMVAQLKTGDTATIVLAGPLARVIDTTADKKVLTGELSRLTPSLGQADLTGALTLAAMSSAAAPRGSPPRRPHIVVFTTPDAHIPTLHGWPAAAQPEVKRFGSSDDDQGIMSITSRCPNAGATCEVFARVGNYASRPVTDPITLWIDGQSQGTQPLVLSPHATTDLIAQVPRSATLIHLSLGRLDILATDNDAFVSVPHERQTTVLVVSDDPGTIDRALHDLPNVQVTDQNTSAYSSDTNTNPPDVTIFDSFFPQTSPSGNLLLINPPQDNSLLPYDHDLSDIQPSTVQTNHPLLAGVDLGPLVVARSAAYSPPLPPWIAPLVSSAAGPLMLVGTMPTGQRTVVWGFGLGDTNIPRLAAFPLLMRNVVGWLTPALPASLVPDSPLAAPLLHGATGLSMRGPAGLPVSPALTMAGTQFYTPDTYKRVGVYQLHQEGASPAVPDELLVANAQPPALENPASISLASGSPATDLQTPDLHWLSEHAGIVDLRLWFLALALLVLGGEWWYYGVRT